MKPHITILGRLSVDHYGKDLVKSEMPRHETCPVKTF